MFEKDEVYTLIHDALSEKISLDSQESKKFVHEITLTARAGVVEYVRELEEALGHLQETVKRLSRVDS